MLGLFIAKRKMKKLLSILLLYCVCILFLRAETKIALIGDSLEANELADRVLVKLSKKTDFELLERRQIEAILKERKLQTFALTGRKLTKLAKILYADIFVIISTIDKNQNRKLIEVRAFNAKNGYKLCHVSFEAKNALESISSAITETVKKYNSSKTIYLSISGIKNAGAHKKLESRATIIATAIENILLRSPEIAFLERENLQQVVSERLISRQQYQLTVPSFHLFLEIEGKNILRIYLFSSDNKNDKCFSFSIEPDNFRQISLEIATAVAKYINSEHQDLKPLPSHSQSGEIEKLFIMFNHHDKKRNYDKAYRNIAAIIALDPMDKKYYPIYMKYCRTIWILNKFPFINNRPKPGFKEVEELFWYLQGLYEAYSEKFPDIKSKCDFFDFILQCAQSMYELDYRAYVKKGYHKLLRDMIKKLVAKDKGRSYYLKKKYNDLFLPALNVDDMQEQLEKIMREVKDKLSELDNKNGGTFQVGLPLVRLTRVVSDKHKHFQSLFYAYIRKDKSLFEFAANCKSDQSRLWGNMCLLYFKAYEEELSVKDFYKKLKDFYSTFKINNLSRLRRIYDVYEYIPRLRIKKLPNEEHYIHAIILAAAEYFIDISEMWLQKQIKAQPKQAEFIKKCHYEYVASNLSKLLYGYYWLNREDKNIIAHKIVEYQDLIKLIRQYAPYSNLFCPHFIFKIKQCNDPELRKQAMSIFHRETEFHRLNNPFSNLGAYNINAVEENGKIYIANLKYKRGSKASEYRIYEYSTENEKLEQIHLERNVVIPEGHIDSNYYPLYANNSLILFAFGSRLITIDLDAEPRGGRRKLIELPDYHAKYITVMNNKIYVIMGGNKYHHYQIILYSCDLNGENGKIIVSNQRFFKRGYLETHKKLYINGIFPSPDKKHLYISSKNGVIKYNPQDNSTKLMVNRPNGRANVMYYGNALFIAFTNAQICEVFDMEKEKISRTDIEHYKARIDVLRYYLFYADYDLFIDDHAMVALSEKANYSKEHRYFGVKSRFTKVIPVKNRKLFIAEKNGNLHLLKLP